jgi:hypothetical protein
VSVDLGWDSPKTANSSTKEFDSLIESRSTNLVSDISSISDGNTVKGNINDFIVAICLREVSVELLIECSRFI